MREIKINIGVGGRFHADYMAQAFLDAGFRTTLVTSYPKYRFPQITPHAIRSFVAPEIAYRGLKRCSLERLGEQVKMRTFGTFLSYTEPVDFSFVWSSFALERFRKGGDEHRVLMRDSTHILHQCEVLAVENSKLGIAYAPDSICVNRELEEYQLADTVIVLSQFAKKTFIERGIPDHKIKVIPLGVNTSLFHPNERTKPSSPVRLLYFGTISVRKGIHYLLEATKNLPSSLVKLSLVGPVEKSFQPIMAKYDHFDYYPAMPHARLARFVAESDLYVFPSLEDGFPNTLVQAMSSGLVPITTGQCGPAELITAGTEGFIVPPAETEILRETIVEAAQNPDRLMKMRARASELGTELSWKNYQTILVNFIHETLQKKGTSVPPLAERNKDERAASFRGGATVDLG